jgi:uncharacterized protein
MMKFRVSIALAAGMLSAAAIAQTVPLSLSPGEVLLQVDAEGEFRSKPDVMAITAGVVTSGKTAAEALAANNEKSNRMLEAVHGVGVAPTDVQTSGLSVDPVMPEDNSGQPKRAAILGYVAKNIVELRLRDLNRAPDVIDALFNAGANSVHGPDFSLSNPEPAQWQARHNAAAAARKEAETYADAFGMKVARVIRASERGDFNYEGNESIIVTGSRILRTRIEPGELRTTIHVWVDYALIPK